MRFRKRAREKAFVVLYRWDIRGDSLERVFQEYLEEKGLKNREVREYMTELLSVLKDNLTDIDSLISEHAEEWSLDRLGYIERNVLRLGVAELIFMNPPDPGRAFNDYVGIVKKYADRRAARFVNGVLSGIYKRRRAISSVKGRG
ncbi:MAG TPA: transcription antitermination factor NusB [Aquifex aeolicus]|nr:transcription antitermination factor NusB [Aquifex aeolicus]